MPAAFTLWARRSQHIDFVGVCPYFFLRDLLDLTLLLDADLEAELELDFEFDLEREGVLLDLMVLEADDLLDDFETFEGLVERETLLVFEASLLLPERVSVFFAGDSIFFLLDLSFSIEILSFVEDRIFRSVDDPFSSFFSRFPRLLLVVKVRGAFLLSRREMPISVVAALPEGFLSTCWILSFFKLSL